jgi:uncharacterized repeat protein (TIGR01451 family)
MAANEAASLSLVVQPTASGLVSNSAVVATASTDPNADDNSAVLFTTVLPPSADLALGMLSVPNQAGVGQNITYVLRVTNLGPATATSLQITNTLPPTVNFVSASPSGYKVVGSVVTFTNLGSLANGGVATATIVVNAGVPGTLTNAAICGSSILDPLKANNSASVKTIVEGAQISAIVSGSNLVISWPAGSINYTLEYATNLVSPISWTIQSNPPPALNNGQYTVTIPVGPGGKFFRLRGTVP